MVRRAVSGRYRGSRHGFEVQLRVDVDGPRSVNRISADYFRRSARETTYAGSMRVDAPAVTVTGMRVTITGTARFSLRTKCKRVKVTIAHSSVRNAPAVATLRHLAAPGAAGTAYECTFESAGFRHVELEEAFEKGVKPFETYDTAALPAAGSPRVLTHVKAYEEAGIEMRCARPPTEIDTSSAGANATWSDAELHAAMQEHFSRWADRPQWAIWLLHAASHDDERIAGLMFDQRGAQRQGCAVFYGYGTDTSAEIDRDHLYTCVHELGHGFNLPHCWQKSLTDPPLPSRPDAASWMNYPERFPGGADAYWPGFQFGFDDIELVHLRHAFQDSVIMGGEPFAGGAARTHTPAWDLDEPADRGLRLKLSAPHALVQNVPVSVGLEMSAGSRERRQVPPVMGPRAGNVDIAIRRPNGTEFVFEPLLHHCRGNEMITIGSDDPPVRDYAFIHYGKQGYAFDRPGQYFVRARFAPADGPVVLSNIASVHVNVPTSRVDRHVAQLIGGDEQVGTLMSLMGSDARGLQRGNNRLQEIIRRYPNHPVAMVGRLAQAANLARGFKVLQADGTVGVRAPRIEEAAALVSDVIERVRVQTPSGPIDEVRVKPGIDSNVGDFARSRPKDTAAPMGRNRSMTKPELRGTGGSLEGPTGSRPELTFTGKREASPATTEPSAEAMARPQSSAPVSAPRESAPAGPTPQNPDDPQPSGTDPQPSGTDPPPAQDS